MMCFIGFLLFLMFCCVYIFLDKERLKVVMCDEIEEIRDREVEKIGRLIGIIIGFYRYNYFLVFMKLLIYKYCNFDKCFVIEDIENESFFIKGDFGLGVFLKEKDGILGLLGIVFVFMDILIVVCRIDKIVIELGLVLVKYF